MVQCATYSRKVPEWRSLVDFNKNVSPESAYNEEEGQTLLGVDGKSPGPRQGDGRLVRAVESSRAPDRDFCAQSGHFAQSPQ